MFCRRLLLKYEIWIQIGLFYNILNNINDLSSLCSTDFIAPDGLRLVWKMARLHSTTSFSELCTSLSNPFTLVFTSSATKKVPGNLSYTFKELNNSLRIRMTASDPADVHDPDPDLVCVVCREPPPLKLFETFIVQFNVWWIMTLTLPTWVETNIYWRASYVVTFT